MFAASHPRFPDARSATVQTRLTEPSQRDSRLDRGELPRHRTRLAASAVACEEPGPPRAPAQQAGLTGEWRYRLRHRRSTKRADPWKGHSCSTSVTPRDADCAIFRKFFSNRRGEIALQAAIQRV